MTMRRRRAKRERLLRDAANEAISTLGEILTRAHAQLDRAAVEHGVEFPSDASFALKGNLLEAAGIDPNSVLE